MCSGNGCTTVRIPLNYTLKNDKNGMFYDVFILPQFKKSISFSIGFIFFISRRIVMLKELNLLSAHNVPNIPLSACVSNLTLNSPMRNMLFSSFYHNEEILGTEEENRLSQIHTTNKWQSQDLNLGITFFSEPLHYILSFPPKLQCCLLTQNCKCPKAQHVLTPDQPETSLGKARDFAISSASSEIYSYYILHPIAHLLYMLLFSTSILGLPYSSDFGVSLFLMVTMLTDSAFERALPLLMWRWRKRKRQWSLWDIRRRKMNSHSFIHSFY